LSIDSTLYEPLSYNNGASWPFLTGFAALALYSNGRPDAAWQYLDGLADLTFLESRGYMAELFSGDRLRSVDAAVPHQLFATTGLVSTVLRGLVGLGTAPAATVGNTAVPERMVLAPRLPAGWGWLRIRNLRWRGVTADVAITRDERSYTIAVNPRGGTLPLELRASFGPETLVDRDARGRPTSVAGAWRRIETPGAAGRGPSLWRFEQVSAAMNVVLPVSPGIEFVPVHKPLAVGDASARLRVIDAWMDGNIYRVKVEGRRGQAYFARLRVPYPIVALSGAQAAVTQDGRPAPGPVQELRIVMPPEVPLVVNQAGAVVPQDKAASRRSEWATQIISVTLAK
jgi:hypothetical protein